MRSAFGLVRFRSFARSTRLLAALRIAGLVLLACWLGFGCRADSTPQVGGETHWLAACSRDTDCSEDRCICGVCTRTCSGDSTCRGAITAQCYDVRSPGLTEVCDSAAPVSKAICLATCQADGDCPHGDRCRSGACIADSVASPDASTSCTGADCPLTAVSKASDFLGLDSGVNFDNPVQPPAAARNIEGSVAAIAGHWQQMNCGSNCLSLVIDAQSGYVTRSSNGDPSDVAHAFAASIDAEHGYPAELSPAQYGFVRDNGIAEQHYTLLDGKMTGDGHFSAWFSYLELWEAWCGRQAPMRVDVHGESRYVCAPDIRDEAVDLGKRVLCTSADMDQVCDVAGISGGSAPCVCKADWEAGNPLCSPSYCRCFESGCDANIWAGAQWLDLRVSGEQLLGTWIGGLSGSALSIALMRQNP